MLNGGSDCAAENQQDIEAAAKGENIVYPTSPPRSPVFRTPSTKKESFDDPARPGDRHLGEVPWRALGDEPLGTAVGDRHVPAGWSGAGALGTGMWGEGCWTGAVGEVAVGTDTAQAVEDGARTVGRAPGVSPHLAPAMGTCTTLGAVGVGLSAHPQSAAPASDWGQAMGDRPIRSSDGGQAHTLVHTLVHTLDIL